MARDQETEAVHSTGDHSKDTDTRHDSVISHLPRVTASAKARKSTDEDDMPMTDV